ncbi:hypothetical protein EUGRSUZ_G00409, partial [Eucalyptus grandis]
MTDIDVSVAAKVAEYLVAPVGRRCGYVIFTDSYVGQLREELEKLHEVRVGVQRSVNDAENNMMDIRLEVNRWKNDAENSADEARGVLNNDRRANKTCFCGWLPNPKERYCLGRDARKTAQAIQALIPQGNFERVYYERAPPGHVPSASDVNLSADDGGDTITDSRASIFQDIVEALDGEKQKVIGVYGPGGVGKTTLLEEVEKKLKKEGRPFRMIVKAKVSQTPDLNKIQDDIAYFFGLKLKDEPSEVRRRDLLCQRLQKDPSEKILIILDDLWKELDLREVGIPSGDESKGCKLLLTSRFKNVLEQMKCDTPIFHLEGLKYDEAFRLFEKTVGDRLKEDEELKAIAPKVVKKLAGLPLLIISVACSLKDRNVDAWRIALKKIDLSKMETIVKLSYDHLKSEDTKTLFLLCGLIGGTIQVEILLVLGMGLGLFEEFGTTIQDSRAGLNAMLNELRSVWLLLDGGDDKNNVTIHDLYSEVVTSTPFGGQNSLMMNSNYGSWPKEKLEKCWAICQVHVGRDRLDKLMKCQFANLKILMLSQPPNWYRIPEHLRDMGDHLGLLDFTCMKELQVLYLCSMRITSLHSSIRILGNLQSLYLESCNVEDVAILGNLKALQILSFARSKISRLPKKIQELTNLRLLNLSYCKLKIIKPDVLKCLTNLEELLMMGSFNQWMGKNEKPLELRNAGLAELRSMTKLNSLEISIRDPIVLLEVDDLPFENLTRFWINIGNIDRREFKGLKTMKIKLEAHDSILSKTWIQKTLQKTQYLCLDGLGEFEKAHKLCIQGFPELKHLDIQNSPSMKYVASSSNSAFTILESLFLNNLINLEKICHHHITADCFSKLKDVIVNNCNRLKYLWCLSQRQNFVQLEKIEVWNCGSVRAIARKDIVSTNYKVELPYLHHLHLVGLPNMTTFCTRAEMTSEGAPIQ